MHKLLLVILLLLFLGGQQYTFAQFSGGRLQATGLTCALCNKAIHQSLEQLPFVTKVEADIKSSSFTLTFGGNGGVSPAKLKAAVEDAGFFVGELQLTGTWNQDPIEGGVPFVWGEQTFEFISAKTPATSKAFNCIVVGKGYLTEKGLKRIRTEYSEFLKTDKALFQLLFVK